MLLASTYATDTPRVKNEAESLRHLYKVTILSWDRSGAQPKTSQSPGIDVINYKLLNGATFSKLRYAVSAISFQFACFIWCMKKIKKESSLIIHAHDFDTLAAAVFLRILHGNRIKLIYDSHELTPAAFSEWYDKRIGNIVGALEKAFLKFVDAIITVSPPIKQYLSSICDRPVFLIYNTIRLSDVPKQDKEWWRARYGLDGFVVSYVGHVRVDTATEELIEAARKCASITSGIRFVIVGDGSKLDVAKKQASGTEKYLEFLPHVSHDLALGYLKASDLTFAVYKNLGDNTRIAMPWKVFESMACGTALLVREDTYTWQFVKDLGIGLSAGSGTSEEISNQIIWAFRHPESMRSVSSKAEKRFVAEFNWDNMERTLQRIYRFS
jgi:glycosyltransferase involved in cell wall biosynthesis